MRVYANAESLPTNAQRIAARKRLASVSSHPESMTLDRFYAMREAATELGEVSGTRVRFIAYVAESDMGVSAESPRAINGTAEFRWLTRLSVRNGAYQPSIGCTTGVSKLNIIAMFDMNGKVVYRQGDNTLERKRYDPRKRVTVVSSGSGTRPVRWSVTEPSPDGGLWTPIVMGYAIASDLAGINRHGKPGVIFSDNDGYHKWHSLGDCLRVRMQPLDKPQSRGVSDVGKRAAKASDTDQLMATKVAEIVGRNSLRRTRGACSFLTEARRLAKADNNTEAVALLSACLDAGTASILIAVRGDRKGRPTALQHHLDVEANPDLLRCGTPALVAIVRPYIEAALDSGE